MDNDDGMQGDMPKANVCAMCTHEHKEPDGSCECGCKEGMTGEEAM